MGQRQDGQERVFAPIYFVRIPRLEHVVAEVAVAEHHALGVACGARCVDDGGYIGGIGHFAASVAGIAFIKCFDKFKVADIYYQIEAVIGLLADFGQLFAAYEYGLGLGVGEYILHLVGRKVGQHGHCYTSVSGYAKEGYGPVGHVLGQYGYLIGRIESEGSQYAR